MSVTTMTLEFDKKNAKGKIKKTLKTSLSVPHIKAVDYENKKNLGMKKYTEKLIDEAPIEKGSKSMGSSDKKALLIKFNTTYYLAKNERPLTIFLILLNCRRKAE